MQAHDEMNACNIGDVVRVDMSRYHCSLPPFKTRAPGSVAGICCRSEHRVWQLHCLSELKRGSVESRLSSASDAEKLVRMLAGRSARGRRGFWQTLYSGLRCTTLPQLRKPGQRCFRAPATALHPHEVSQRQPYEAAEAVLSYRPSMPKQRARHDSVMRRISSTHWDVCSEVCNAARNVHNCSAITYKHSFYRGQIKIANRHRFTFPVD